jgi:M6 family metalloprotease-like protein
MKAKYEIARSRKVNTLFFLIAVLLFSTLHPNNLRPAYAQQGGTVSLSGWLIILHGDSQDGSVTKDIPVLDTEDGRSVPLLLDENAAKSAGSAGGLLALDRKRITVDGTWWGALSAQGGPEPFRVTSIARVQAPDAAASPASAVTGPQKWISILCKFQDVAAEPQDLSYFQNMYMNSYPGLDHYWREQSYGLINTLGSTASGWYVLSHPHSYYLSGSSFNLDQAAADCTGVANPSINFSTYAGINLMFNDVLDGYAWGGGQYMTLDGVTKVWRMTWEPPWGYGNIAVLGHEMGHGLGLPHSSGNYGETYDNEWDVMSDTWSGCYQRTGPDPVYGCLGQHTISYHKDILGWIPAAQKTSVAAGSSQTAVLEQLALPQTSNLKMVKIPIGGSSTHFYTVEARRLTGYDVQLPGDGVIIHEVDTTRYAAPAHVIDVDNNGITGDDGAMWTTGEIFRGATHNIAVAVLAKTTSGFRVHVSSGLNIYYVTGDIGVSNVTINYTGGSTTTDSTGRYIFPVSAGWSGTVTPSKTGYTFSPANRSYSNVTSDKTAQDFAALSFYSISGTTEAAGVTLSYTDGTTKTVSSQPNSNYSLTVPSGWTGIVTPSHACFSFSPANRGYSNLAGSQTSQNFTPSLNSGLGCADITAQIGGVNRGRFGLLPGASTRTSFTGVNNGPVKIVSTNALPLIAAERVIYKVNNVNTSFTEMMGLPNSELDNVYYLPWYNNVDLDTQLRFANVSGSIATVHVFIGGSEMTGSPFMLPAGGSTRKSFPGINAGPVKIESDVNIVAAERLIYNVNGVDTSFSEMMGLPEQQLDTTFWLPWYNNVDLDTQLRFANVSGSPALVYVYIGGENMPGSPFSLAAGESTRKSFPGVNAGLVEIFSTQNIVAAERVIYKVNNVPTSFTETMAVPTNQLNTTYWLPWYNNVDLDTQLRFVNVGNALATVHIFIGGAEVTGSPFTLQVGESTRKSFPGVNAGPVHMVSDQNIVATERVIYKVDNVGASFSEMAGLPAPLLNSSFWLPWYNNVDLDTQLRFAAP